MDNHIGLGPLQQVVERRLGTFYRRLHQSKPQCSFACTQGEIRQDGRCSNSVIEIGNLATTTTAVADTHIDVTDQVWSNPVIINASATHVSLSEQVSDWVKGVLDWQLGVSGFFNPGGCIAFKVRQASIGNIGDFGLFLIVSANNFGVNLGELPHKKRADGATVATPSFGGKMNFYPIVYVHSAVSLLVAPSEFQASTY